MKGRSVYEDLEWKTIPQMVEASAANHADQEALVDGDLRWSYRELGNEIRRASRAAMHAGIEYGDRVAIWAPNIHQWILAALGSIGAGAAIVPLNTRYKGREAGYVLRKSRATVLFVVTDFLDLDYPEMLRSAMGGPEGNRPIRGLPDLRSIVVMRGDAPEGMVPWDEFRAGADQVSEEDRQRRAGALAYDDLCDILFTSGTTGQPKGVMLMHGQTLRVFRDWSSIIGLRSGDRYLIVNPFFHVFGYKAGFLSAIMRGATIIPLETFDVPKAMATIEHERISMFPGPPTIHQTILNHPDRDAYDLSSLRLCATGAAEVPVEMIRRMRSEMSYENIVTGYGLTECTGTATMCRYDDDPETIATTSGRAIPDVEVKIVDDDLEEVPRGDQGEIIIRGYNVMRGYYDDPEQTAGVITPDGWLHSGDLGVMDEHGYVQITGRKKDMLTVGGFNVYPAEVENALLEHALVAQAAVVGVPDERMGEVPMAFVIAREGRETSEDELIGWCRERLANYKVPRYVQLVQQLPMNAVGKVVKDELREKARQTVRIS